MSQSWGNPFSPSSPHSSSGGPDSFKGTPDTRVTAFSPDDGSAKSTRLLKGLTRSAPATSPVKSATGGYRGPLSPLSKDPFVTPGRGKQLSPTASTFKPFTTMGLTPHYPKAVTVSTALSTDLGLSRVLDVSYPFSLTTPDVEAWLLVCTLGISSAYGPTEVVQ